MRRLLAASTVLRTLAAFALVATLGGCTTEPARRLTATQDAKPHPGVQRAQTLPIQGIDVSKWQGEIDWTAVRDSGTKFAFIKATEGGDLVDDRFRQNWADAKAAGVARGAYHFVYWCRPAHEQAAWFKRHIPADPDALPPVLDVEWNGHSPTCPKRVPRDQAVAAMQTMLDELEAHTGKRPIIYTDISFFRDVMADGAFAEYPLWVRTVAAEPHEKYGDRRWHLWQFTTTGRIAGIRGDVDRNAFYGTADAWERFAKGRPIGGTLTSFLQ